MYTPNDFVTPASETASHLITASDSKPPGGWSSLIGIITAICGNILISFALNTQRYAHMRLNRDREEWEEKQKARRKSPQRRKPRTYGTQQEEIAEQRAVVNTKSEPDGELDREEADVADEEQPLIPRLGGHTRNASTDSEETVRPEKKGEEEKEEHHDKSYLKSPIWWAGIAMMVLGEAGNFLAYGFAPASIVSPLGVVALVSNCLIAPLLLGERFRWRDAVGVLIAIAGCVTVVLSASDSNPKLDPDKIWRLLGHWEFETYLGITIFLIIALSVASTKHGHKTILIDLGLVGLYGGYTALSTKGIASLLSASIWRVVTFPITYLLLAVLIFTAVMQIKYVNRALQHFNATMVIPTQFVMFTLSVIIGSAILYRDFEREATDDAIKFVGGCALTFLGVWCITSGRRDDEEEDLESGEEEDAIDLVDEEHLLPEIREREDDDGGRRRSIIAGSSGETPQLKRFRTAESQTPSVVVTPELRPGSSEQTPDGDQLASQPPPDPQQTLSPGASSAIHTKSMTQLTSPSQSSLQQPQQPPPLHATTSEPVIAQQSSLAPTSSPRRPHTPLKRNISTPIQDSPAKSPPATPDMERRPSQPTNLLDPNQSHRLLSRQSVAGLLPGPLMSPLSTSLSAIVADSLRRGEGTPGSTLRRKRSKSRRRPGGDGRKATAALKRHSIASGDIDFGDEEGDGGAAAEDHAGRLRSLSATWGEIFGRRPRAESKVINDGNVGQSEDEGEERGG